MSPERESIISSTTATFLSTCLNINQSFEELNQIHSDNYYDYLISEEFIESFIKPTATVVNQLGVSCLDVGCGEGLIGDYVTVPYTGFDGSKIAIERARQRNPKGDYRIARIECPQIVGNFDTLIFSGILKVLVLKDRLLDFILTYTTLFNSKYVVICDLKELDLLILDRALGDPLMRIESSTFVKDIPEVKNHRNIRAYQCRP